MRLMCKWLQIHKTGRVSRTSGTDFAEGGAVSVKYGMGDSVNCVWIYSRWQVVGSSDDGLGI
jgi:hypothetical protein